MRQIGTLDDETQARRFEDYLLAQGVRSQLEPEDERWAVWILDEDQVAQARQELEQFRQSPADPKYGTAASAAQKVRKEDEARQREYRRNQVDIRRRWNRPAGQRAPITWLLIAASVLVAFLTGFGARWGSVQVALTISSYVVNSSDYWFRVWEGLGEIRGGEVWRLVTPILLHFSFLHLAFNMYMLFQFGLIVEGLRGSVRFGLLVLLLAVTSNVGQYLWNGPVFGGMSGVVYGLFGYCWMKSRFDPTAGIAIDPTTVVILLGWFVLGVVGFIGSVANMAHAAGLGVGMAAGYAPVLWRDLRRR